MAQLVPAPVLFRKTSSSLIFLIYTPSIFDIVPAIIHPEVLQVTSNFLDSIASHRLSQGHKVPSLSMSSIHFIFLPYRENSLCMSFTVLFSTRWTTPVYLV